MKITTKDWSALLDYYPENKEFKYTENVRTAIDSIVSGYNGLDRRDGEIVLTSSLFPQLLMDENVLLFFVNLYRAGIIDDLYLPVKISNGPGELTNFHYGPDYLGSQEATKSPIVLGLEATGALVWNPKQKPNPLQNRAFAKTNYSENITTDSTVIISPVRGGYWELNPD